MLLCYIDESGNTGNNLKDVHQPYLVLVALLVPPENIKEIENDIRTLSYKYFGAESRNTDFEFHGDDIYNKRGRYFKKLSLEQRIKILDEIVDIALKHEPIKIGYISIEKAKYYGELHIQQSAFSMLVEKVEEMLQGHLDSYCLLIADEQDEVEQNIIDDLDNFKQHGIQTGYGQGLYGKGGYNGKLYNHRIIDSVHFVKSNNNYLMQLTDVICYLIRRGKEANIKLFGQYKLEREELSNVDFKDWLEKHAHIGQKYFYKKHEQISSRKAWIFSKDFP